MKERKIPDRHELLAMREKVGTLLELVRPDHRADLKRYFDRGIEPIGFLGFVVAGDPAGAKKTTEPMSSSQVDDYFLWLATNAPVGSWGTKELVAAWVKHRGLAGLQLGEI